MNLSEHSLPDMKNKRLVLIVAAVAALLLIPFAAMKLGVGFNWSPFDFAVVGVLLLGTGLACEAVLRTVKQFRYRVAICAAILFVLALVWIELAVGLFGTPLAGN